MRSAPAQAAQVIYRSNRLGIANYRLGVDGTAIAAGHSWFILYALYAHLVGRELIEGKRRGAKRVVVTMCIQSGTGAAGLLEIV